MHIHMQVSPSPPPPRLRSVFVPVPQQEPQKSVSTPAVMTASIDLRSSHAQPVCTPALSALAVYYTLFATCEHLQR